MATPGNKARPTNRPPKKAAARRKKPATRPAVPSMAPAVPSSTGAPELSQARSGPAPIRELTQEQFAEMLKQFVSIAGNRVLREVHLHHTWRPRQADFRGRSTVEAMRRVHMEDNGWSDIAQHITIDPVGRLWTGRSWNAPPASSAGRNGSFASGPFMFEMVGNFDVGRDPFDGVQKAAAIEAVASVLVATKAGPAPIAIADVKFHRDLGSPKSCPGTSIDKAELLTSIEARVAARLAPQPALQRTRGAASRSAPLVSASDRDSELLGALMSRSLAIDADSAEVHESERTGYAIIRRERSAPGSSSFTAIRSNLAEEQLRASSRWESLRPHVVNLSKGRLSTGGEFAMDSGSIDAILDGIRGYARTTATPRLMLWAHGGLVSESDGLAYAQATRAWWLAHDVYPVYFVWESGFLDTILQSFIGARGLGDLWDAALENLARPVGRPLWTAMKTSARLASAMDTGDGWPGGAWYFANLLEGVLEELSTAGHPVEVHAVGHSAGAIFHGHLIPVLTGRNRAVDSLCLLAPAIRVDRFREMLEPVRDAGLLRTLHLFTMKEDAELSDHVGPYLKSMLYLISRAFEPQRPTPILGLEESILADAALGAWLETHAELQFSYPPDFAPNPLCQALSHGAFDNDRFTVSAVLRRIKQVPDATCEGCDDFPEEESSRAESSRASVALTMPPLLTDTHPVARAATGGRRLAVCVGIDRYRSRPLNGCVADARRWTDSLRGLDFEVVQLFDEAATRTAILSALERMIAGSRAGDHLVFQYSGHGTQVEDRNADEGDGYDEAFVPIDGEAGQLLLDDDIAAVVARVPRRVVLTLFMDCCHSGTISRFSPAGVPAGPDEHVRYLPLTPAMIAAHEAFRTGMPSADRGRSEDSLPGVVHFAACRDSEYAWESQGQGDFTRAATALLTASVSRRVANEAFIDAVAVEVGKRGRQHPGLMRLPASLRTSALLGGPGARDEEPPGNAGAGPAGEAGAGPASDAELLRLAEALVAALRSRVAT